MSDPITKQRRTRKYVNSLIVHLVWGPMRERLITETDLTEDTIQSMCRDAADAAITFYDEKKEYGADKIGIPDAR